MQARHELRRRRLAPVAVVLSSAIVLACVGGAFAATSQTVVIADDKDDVTGALDIQRASLSLAADGRLRAVITLVDKIEPKAMLAGSGPPGSVCLKIWTKADADPSATRADRLVCVTARTDDELRASVFEQTEPGLPRPLGSASVGVNESERSFVVRVSQSSLGRPELIRFAIESTRPGCERVSCIDAAPGKGAVRRFRIRGSAR